ncbi:unnamed protein product [Triticum turgidum subsp. durum]|uniref:Uncharacterized protein n=1 Tax=Triticum turgidum subsp. durum TaxID=4567 RepID=A0A9R1PX69_TRITD|nr:unnamed protein product [Triticum turgidum subsp. durum]
MQTDECPLFVRARPISDPNSGQICTGADTERMHAMPALVQPLGPPVYGTSTPISLPSQKTSRPLALPAACHARRVEPRRRHRPRLHHQHAPRRPQKGGAAQEGVDGRVTGRSTKRAGRRQVHADKLEAAAAAAAQQKAAKRRVNEGVHGDASEKARDRGGDAGKEDRDGGGDAREEARDGGRRASEEGRGQGCQSQDQNKRSGARLHDGGEDHYDVLEHGVLEEEALLREDAEGDAQA